jgi:hypothetical protein
MVNGDNIESSGSGWQEYERIARDIYEAILRREGSKAEVKHNVTIKGRSGVGHQIDVYWKIRQAGVDHTVLIDCKDFGRPVSLEKVRNWFGVMQDVTNCNAVLVTREGYQSGAAQFANFYGIGLKLLRHPTDEDWSGHIRDIHFILDARFPIGPLKITPQYVLTDIGQGERLRKQVEEGRIEKLRNQKMKFENSQKEVFDHEKIWLRIQKEIKAWEQDPGGPYNKQVPMEDCYLVLDDGQPDSERVKVSHFDVTYHVQASSQTRSLYGDEVVDMILKDFESGEHEYVKRHL